MKGKIGLYVCAFYSIFPMYLTISSTLYASGSWCPYQVEKVVPCRVRNGTEPYYGTNICWRNENGSYACTKKLMYRAKYTTTYKKVRETKYRCCPGRDGPECENECFNCTTFRKLESRISAQERRLGRLEKSLNLQKASTTGDRFHRDFSSENSVYSAASPAPLPPPPTAPATERSSEGAALSLAYATLNLRVQTILDEFREMQNRIRYLENEVARLNTQVDDLSLGSNIAYDYSGSSSGGSSSANIFHGRKDTRNSVAATNNKDSPALTQNETTNEDDINGINKDVSDRILVTGRHDHEAHHHRHSHNSHHHHRHHPHQQQNNHQHRHTSVKSDSSSGSPPFRVLEENLERGDIASTLNDDYGDELYNDNSTEQYIDQLQAKREQHSP